MGLLGACAPEQEPMGERFFFIFLGAAGAGKRILAPWNPEKKDYGSLRMSGRNPMEKRYLQN